jgi:hypothetical protein
LWQLTRQIAATLFIVIFCGMPLFLHLYAFVVSESFFLAHCVDGGFGRKGRLWCRAKSFWSAVVGASNPNRSQLEASSPAVSVSLISSSITITVYDGGKFCNHTANAWLNACGDIYKF